MRDRPRTALVGFAASVALVVAGLSALTAAALRSERAERETRERSALEEDVRLALWRMDAAFAAFLASENSRPVDRFVARDPARAEEEVPFVERRFEVDADGRLRTAAGRPAPDWLTGWIGEPAVQRADRPDPLPPPAPAEVPADGRKAPERGLAERQDPVTQQQLNTLEFQQRVQLGSQAASLPPAARDEPAMARDEPAAAAVEPPARRAPRREDRIREPLTAHWVGDRLLLRRRVIAAGSPREQITWLDWPRLGEFLLAQARELLPEASLLAAAEEVPADPGRRLALLPVRLDPGPAAPVAPAPLALSSPLGAALAVAWGATALALAGVGLLLWGSVRLSRRREEFVSAVTHELRTPLTTFRLHSELLAQGMLPPGERQAYAEALQRQADRLGHLVDNVLSFSRLEKGRWRPPPAIDLGEILDPVLTLLAERAREAGLELTVELSPEVLATRVAADRERLERILFNLVDNACKYAADAKPARIEIAGDRRGSRLVLSVRDHGRGVPPSQRRRLFRPFHKSAEHAAGSAPGVGLGLSLARRLARGLGGELVLAEVGSGRGAVFELELRLG